MCHIHHIPPSDSHSREVLYRPSQILGPGNMWPYVTVPFQTQIKISEFATIDKYKKIT